MTQPEYWARPAAGQSDAPESALICNSTYLSRQERRASQGGPVFSLCEESGLGVGPSVPTASGQKDLPGRTGPNRRVHHTRCKKAGVPRLRSCLASSRHFGQDDRGRN